MLCWSPGSTSGGGSSALVLCGVGISVAMVGGLRPLTVVIGVSILCGVEVLGPPIFIVILSILYCYLSHNCPLLLWFLVLLI